MSPPTVDIGSMSRTAPLAAAAGITSAPMTASTSPRVRTSNSSNHTKQQTGASPSHKSSSSPSTTATATATTPTSVSSSSSSRRELPALFWYMESGDWDKAAERVRRHPREVKTWATLRTKSIAEDGSKISGTKRLALHHACFKLRGAGSIPPTQDPNEDTFLIICRFILMLIRLYPEAASQRESRHGCLPLHLAAFASCAPRYGACEDQQNSLHVSQGSVGSIDMMSLTSQSPTEARRNSSNATNKSAIAKPNIISIRSTSDATSATTETNLSAINAEETYSGAGMMAGTTGDQRATSSNSNNKHASSAMIMNPNVSVSMRSSNLPIHAQREELAVQVINALLDAYPKGVRVDSEGGRLPLHTACAGRATPRVVSTLVTAYSSAARHRNKDGFLPLHLAAHWGVSHPSVALTLLKAYPDATVGRNRWERTPLEEALCMAGENGRPHQAALVRALRKHPTYWSRPPPTEFMTTTSTGDGRKTSSGTTSRKSTIVDVDESLPSNESSTVDEKQRKAGAWEYDDENFDEVGLEIQLGSPHSSSGVGGGGGRLKNRLSPKNSSSVASAGSGGSSKEDLAPGVSLAILIQNKKWKTVLARIKASPLEAEEELQVTTRGGFVASAGMTALHYACERTPPVEVVQALTEAFSVAVLTRCMPGGCLPLHVACTWNASAEVVRTLLASDPGGASVKDELGNVALHSACFSGSDYAVIEALIQADAKAVLARNHQGSRPIDICKRLRHDNRKAVMSLLTRTKDEVLSRQHNSHERSGSSGSNLSEVGREATALIGRDGVLPSKSPHGYNEGDLDLQENGMAVEVSYSEQENQDKLLWI